MSSVCRVCLTGNVKLYPLMYSPLIEIYQKFTKTRFNSEDGRPKSVCGFCYQKLLNCQTFSEMACKSEEVFSTIFLMGRQNLEITNETISALGLRSKPSLSLGPTHFIKIDVETNYASSEVIIKPEPIPVEEESWSPYMDPLAGASDHSVFTSTGCTSVVLKQEEINADDEMDLPDIEQDEPDNSNESEFAKESYLEECLSTNTGQQPVSSKFEQSSLENMSINLDKKHLACTACYKRFKLKSRLVKHLRICTQINMFECPVCKRRLKSKLALVRHNKKYHNEHNDTSTFIINEHPGMFACNLCFSQFIHMQDLRSHLKFIRHRGEKQFACNKCEEQFDEKSNLNEHMKQHTIKMPHLCKVCDRQFLEMCQLTKHKQIHYSSTHHF